MKQYGPVPTGAMKAWAEDVRAAHTGAWEAAGLPTPTERLAALTVLFLRHWGRRPIATLARVRPRGSWSGRLSGCSE